MITSPRSVRHPAPARSRVTYLERVVTAHEVEVLRLVVLAGQLVDDGPQSLVLGVGLATLVAHDLVHPAYVVLRLLGTWRHEHRLS